MVTVFVVVHSDNVTFVLKFAFILLSSPWKIYHFESHSLVFRMSEEPGVEGI